MPFVRIKTPPDPAGYDQSGPWFSIPIPEVFWVIAISENAELSGHNTRFLADLVSKRHVADGRHLEMNESKCNACQRCEQLYYPNISTQQELM